MKVEWEIDDKELIKLLIENYEFEAKSYIDAQLLIFFQKNKEQIEKDIGKYIQSKEFKDKLIKQVHEHINTIANEEIEW